jgi:protein involved in polysaccharide export with SLBB domain
VKSHTLGIIVMACLPVLAQQANYVLGPNDQILVRAPQSEEINEHLVRVDSNGFIALPLLGHIQAGGLAVSGLQNSITTKLREYLREPKVVVTVVQFRCEPFFVTPKFRAPEIYPICTPGATVAEALSAAGLEPNAKIRVMRGSEPLVRLDDTGNPVLTAVADHEEKISVFDVIPGGPNENMRLQPFDLIVTGHQ